MRMMMMMAILGLTFAASCVDHRTEPESKPVAALDEEHQAMLDKASEDLDFLKKELAENKPMALNARYISLLEQLDMFKIEWGENVEPPQNFMEIKDFTGNIYPLTVANNIASEIERLHKENPDEKATALCKELLRTVRFLQQMRGDEDAEDSDAEALYDKYCGITTTQR